VTYLSMCQLQDIFISTRILEKFLSFSLITILDIPYPFRTKTFVQNRQVFGLDRLNSLKFTILGLNLMFSLHKILIYSGSV